MIVIPCTKADRETLASIPIALSEIEDDGTDYTGVRIKKPWGHELEKYRDEDVAVWWLHIHSGQQTSLHCHVNKTSGFFVMGGEATLRTLGESHLISDGDVVVIEKGAFHQIISNGGPVVLYEFESPANKKDLVRLEDKYGRKGMGYERVEPAPVISKV